MFWQWKLTSLELMSKLLDLLKDLENLYTQYWRTFRNTKLRKWTKGSMMAGLMKKISNWYLIVFVWAILYYMHLKFYWNCVKSLFGELYFETNFGKLFRSWDKGWRTLGQQLQTGRTSILLIKWEAFTSNICNNFEELTTNKGIRST